jgi:hypothetical protein
MRLEGGSKEERRRWSEGIANVWREERRTVLEGEKRGLYNALTPLSARSHHTIFSRKPRQICRDVIHVLLRRSDQQQNPGSTPEERSCDSQTSKKTGLTANDIGLAASKHRINSK